jgi:hypothetical protein
MRWTRAAVLCAVLACARAPAAGQNLFEVQVFPDETLGRGATELEIHNVLIPPSMVAAGSPQPAGHMHLSIEVSHGWTDTFETGVFLETAPDPADAHASISGGHVRPKIHFASSPAFPFHVSASVEYAFFKNPGDRQFRQAITLTPIFERHSELWEVSLNPGLEFPIRGPDAGSAPVFEPSAKIAARASPRWSVGVEYYAETGTIKHVEPLAVQHHLVFPALDVHGDAGWHVNVGIGRGLTGGSEHWVLKSILGIQLSH